MSSRPLRFLIRVRALAAKETTHIVRDLRSLYLAMVMPVLLLLLIGFGLSFDLDRIPLVVVDQDHTAASRSLVQAFVAGDEFRVFAERPDVAAAEALFRAGSASAALVIPEGFARGLDRGQRMPVQFLLDGVDGASATQALGKADALAMAASIALAGRSGAAASIPLAGDRGLARAPAIAASIWTRFNPGGRSALYLVPGLAAFLLALVAVLLTALTVAREWERGSMEQLFATPVGRLEIILGKLAPYLIIGVIQFMTVLAAGAYVFGLPLQGDFLLLSISALLFLFGMLALGLLISIVTRNQMVATQLGTMGSMLPTMMLSGFLFPVENMPTPIRVIAEILPARHFVTLLRGILLKGNSFGELWVDLLALAAFSVLMVIVSTARFQRRLA